MIELKKPECVSSRYGHRSSLASGKFPALVMIVSIFIIASIKCDNVGATNDEAGSPPTSKKSVNQAIHDSIAQMDPLNMLREIYREQGSKSANLIDSSLGSDQVQKFHPNGRYGRRSVDNLEGPNVIRTELAQLQDIKPATSSLGDLIRRISERRASLLRAEDKRQDGTLEPAELSSYDPSLELNKLLKCNYSGHPNLYWCVNSID